MPRPSRKSIENESYFDLRCGAVPDFINAKQYIEAKLIMLRNNMYITPTSKELDHLYSLKTEGDIDRAVRKIIESHWS